MRMKYPQNSFILTTANQNGFSCQIHTNNDVELIDYNTYMTEKYNLKKISIKGESLNVPADNWKIWMVKKIKMKETSNIQIILYE